MDEVGKKELRKEISETVRQIFEGKRVESIVRHEIEERIGWVVWKVVEGIEGRIVDAIFSKISMIDDFVFSIVPPPVKLNL